MKIYKLIFFGFIFMCFSCEKNETKVPDEIVPVDTIVPPNLLTQMIYKRNPDQLDQFVYDGKGNVLKCERLYNGVVEGYAAYFYTAEKLDHANYYTRLSNEPFLLVSTDDYIFDSKNNITKCVHENIYYNNEYNYYYVNEKIDSISFIDKNLRTGGITTGYYKVETDNNGNVVKSVKCILTPAYSIEQPWLYEYDSKKNPMRKLINPDNFTVYFSVSNIINYTNQYSIPDGVNEYTYEYNALDLPIKRTSKKHPFTGISITEYVYSE